MTEGLERDLNRWFDGRALPVTKAIADRWGVLAAKRLDRGRPMSNIDELLGATALTHGLTLVTRNTKDFEDLGVEVLNPWL